MPDEDIPTTILRAAIYALDLRAPTINRFMTRALVAPSRPGGLFGGACETSDAAPGLGFSQGAGRDAQAFPDVLTESEQGLKGGRVGAVGERIQQAAGFGSNIGWFSAHEWAKLTVRTSSGSSKRRVQDVSGQCHVAVPAAGSYMAVYRVPKPISN